MIGNKASFVDQFVFCSPGAYINLVSGTGEEER